MQRGGTEIKYEKGEKFLKSNECRDEQDYKKKNLKLKKEGKAN